MISHTSPFVARTLALLAMTSLLVATATAQTTSLPVNLYDNLGFLWDIQGDGNINNGSNDAYDGGHRLSGFASQSTATTEEGGREVVIGPATINSVEVTRKIYVPAGQAYCRFIDIMHNPSGSEVTFVAQYDTNLGSDSGTVVVDTSNGDTVISAADTWSVTDDLAGSRDPAVVHVIAGPDAGVQPVSFTVPGTGVIEYRYELTLGPGETQAILHFAAQRTQRTDAQQVAQQLALLQLDAAAGMAAEQGFVVNFSFDDLKLPPVAGLVSVGAHSGPFAPTSNAIALTNSGASTVQWSLIAPTSNWVQVSPSGGVLLPGADTTLTASLTANVNALSVGQHQDLFSVSNHVSGVVQSRPLQVTVLPALKFTSTNDLISVGAHSGPFAPTSNAIALTNSGASTLQWSLVAPTSNWVQVSPSGGVLLPGADTTLTASLTANVNALSVGQHQDLFSVSNHVSGAVQSRPLQVTVLPALKFTSTNDLVSVGAIGGPFAPTSNSFALTNSGAATLQWSLIAPTSNWVQITPSGGVLLPGANTNLTASLTANVNALSLGQHQDLFSVSNHVSGAVQSRPLQVTVLPALRFTPTNDMVSLGLAQGQCIPFSKGYTLTNAGNAAIQWSLQGPSEDWADVSPTGGTLQPGEGTVVTASFTTNVYALPMGQYQDMFAISNHVNGTVLSRDISLDLSPADGVLFAEDFESGGPGWTMNGDWEVGRPLVGPGIGASPTNAAGTALNGVYSDDSASTLTSPQVLLPAGFPAGTRVQLAYRQWYDIEAGRDYGRMDVYSQTEGRLSNLERTVTGTSDGWQEEVIDMTAYAGQTIHLQYLLTTDSTIRQAGWYIDDVRVTITPPPPLNVQMISVGSMRFPRVQLNVTVSTNGGSVTSLVTSNFTLLEDGALQTDEFQVIQPNESGGARLADIVFIMDNSGSMSSEQDAVEQNVTNFVASLVASGVDVAFGLCRYGQSENSGNPIVEDAGILTTDPSYFTDVVWQRNVASGGTEPAFYSIVETLNSFIFRPGAQKVLIVITDEEPGQGTLATEQDAIDAATQAGAVVMALTEENLFTLFEPVTEATSGAIYDIRSDFDEILDRISQFISSTYLVLFRSNDPLATAEPRTLELTVEHDGLSTTIEVDYIPRSTPRIVRTAQTLSLHNAARPLSTPVRIQAQISDNVPPVTESAKLFYRTTGQASYRAAAMTNAAGNLWEADIPADFVVFPGVDYFMTATDGETSSSEPSVEPTVFSYQLAVATNTPVIISHTPVTSPPVNTPLTLTATISDTTDYVAGTNVYYRTPGALLYTRIPMTRIDLISHGTIPSNHVTSAGLEYYLHAVDNHGVGQYHGTPDHPHQTLPPEIDISPLSFSPTLHTGGRTSVTVTVEHVITSPGTLFFEPMMTEASTPGIVSFDPVSGFLPVAGSSVPLTVTFDATGRDAGTYPVDFYISNNDRDEGLTQVSATLQVTAAPDIGATNLVEMGEIFLGATAEREVTVTNRGFATLQVTSLQASAAELAVLPGSATLVAGADETVTVTFTPLAVGAFTGTVSMVSNDPDTPLTVVTVTANVLPPPVADIMPVAIATNLTAGTQVTLPLQLSNTNGASDLGYRVTLLVSNAVVHSPDTFGYHYIDSNDPNGPPFHWFDIREMDGSREITPDAGSYSYETLPFEFDFYGKRQVQARVSSYGYLTFGGTGYDSSNDPLPSPSAPLNLVAPFWDALQPGNGSVHAYHDQLGSRFIVQYTGWSLAGGGGDYTFQTHLHSNGSIYFFYQSMAGPVDSATVGCQNFDGSDGLQIAANGPYVEDGLAVLIQPPGGFMEVSASYGVVPSGDTFSIMMTLDTSALYAGTHLGEIRIETDDPQAPQLIVPVSLTVDGSPDIVVGTPVVDYGVALLGESYTNYVRLINSGSADLQISDITIDLPEYVPLMTTATLPPGTDLFVPVVLSPTQVGVVTGVVTVSNSDPDSPTVQATLVATHNFPPSLQATPGALAFTVITGGTDTATLTIDNSTGAGPLQAGLQVLTAHAGGDAFGYNWVHSNTNGGPAYEWMDISTLGTNTGLSGDDSQVEVTLPFPFKFYGVVSTNVKISSNGFLSFGDSATSTTGPELPNTGTPNGVIAAFWQDLASGSGTNFVYHDVARGRYIIQYSHWEDLSGGGSDYTFQIHLTDGNDIFIYYHSMTAYLSESTIGIENQNGTDGISIAYRESFVEDGLAVAVYAPRDLITLSATNVQVGAGASSTVTLTAYAEGLIGDSASGTIRVLSNDPTAPLLDIPFTVLLASNTIPTVNFAVTSASGAESSTPVDVTVELSHPYTGTVTVAHALAPVSGSATNGQDFSYASGSLTFNAGEISKSFSFVVVDDVEPEDDETIVFELGAIANGTTGTADSFVYTILSDAGDWGNMPFAESFEESTLGVLDGQRGWVAQDVEVQSSVTYGGSTQAAAITTGNGSLEHHFNGAKQRVWTDLQVRVAYMQEAPEIPTNVTFAIFVATNSQVMVWDGTNVVSSGLTATEGEWVRFTTYSDYSNATWLLYVNEVEAGPFGFVAPTVTGFQTLSISSGGGNSAVDDILVTETAPWVLYAAGGTITPLTWVEAYGGDPAQANQDSDGLTLDQEYLINTDPTVPNLFEIIELGIDPDTKPYLQYHANGLPNGVLTVSNCTDLATRSWSHLPGALSMPSSNVVQWTGDNVAQTNEMLRVHVAE